METEHMFVRGGMEQGPAKDDTRQFLNTIGRLAVGAGAVHSFDPQLAFLLADLATGVIRSLYPNLEDEEVDEQAEG